MRACTTCFVLLLLVTSLGTGGCTGFQPAADSTGKILPQLPAPSTLYQRQEPAQTSTAELLQEGWGYPAALPHDNVQALTPPDLLFNPHWGAMGGTALSDLAYATWSFDTGAREGTFHVITRWAIAPADGTLWIGLADRSADTWRWFAGSPAEPLALAQLEQFTGASSELLVVIALTGVDPSPAPVLRYVSIDDGALQVDGRYRDFGVNGDVLGGMSNLAFIGGKPAFAIVEAESTNLQYYQANDGHGESWAAPVTLGAAQGAWPGLAEVGGNPALVSQPGLTYQRATAADGTAWGTPVSIISEPVSYCRLCIVDGNPAIVYTTDDGSNGYVKYIRASDPLGASWPADGISLGPPGSFRFYKPEMKLIGGKPCVVCTAAQFNAPGGIYAYCITAQDAAGATWNTPSTIFYDAELSFNDITSVSLLDLNGVPGVGWFYEEYPPNIDQSAISFRYALDAAGNSWSAAQTIFSTPQGYDTLAQARFNTVSMNGELYAMALAVTLNATFNLPQLQGWIVPVAAEGAVDWTGTRAHFHAGMDPLLGKGISSPGTNRQASFLFTMASIDYGTEFDSMSEALYVLLLMLSLMNDAAQPSVKFEPLSIGANGLDWLSN